MKDIPVPYGTPGMTFNSNKQFSLRRQADLSSAAQTQRCEETFVPGEERDTVTLLATKFTFKLPPRPLPLLPKPRPLL